MSLFLKIIVKNLYSVITNKNQRIFHWLCFRYGNKKRYQQIEVTFLTYKITVADPLSFLWQFKEIFADEIYHFESENKHPLIFDCGSNIGLSCLYFATIFPKADIRAFEADPSIAKLLQENSRRNSSSTITVVPKAIWIHNNGVNLSTDGADGGSISNPSSTSLFTPSVRLLDLLENETSIDFLKMDIEGAETEVIKDCKNQLYKIKNLFIKYHSYSNAPQELHTVLTILHENKFRYYTLPVNQRKKPFSNKSLDKAMDFQVNIFAYQL